MATDPEPLIGLVESFSRDGDGIRGFSIKLARRNLPDWPAFIVQTKAVRELDEASRAIVREFRVRSQVVIWTKQGEEHIGGFIAPSEPLYTGINLPYLSTKSFYGRDLVKYFSDAVAPSAEIKSQFVKALCHLIPNLRDVEILLDPVLDSQIVARLHDQDRAQALAFFGDGAVKLARILIQMPMRQGAHLMIDEIDAGIHYSRFTTLWRTTLLAAIANNVQLFITTHNNECLQALARVLETEEFAPYRAECRAFTLRRLPDGSTKAYRRDFEHAMENDYEIRGGQL